MLLAAMLGSKDGEAPIPTQEHQNAKKALSGSRNNQVADTWSTLKGALIVLAGTKARNLLNEALPGFSEQYDRMESENSGVILFTQ